MKGLLPEKVQKPKKVDFFARPLPTKKRKTVKARYIPNARVFVNGVEQEPTLRQVFDTMVEIDIPLKYIHKLATAFGRYTEIKLVQLPPHKK